MSTNPDVADGVSATPNGDGLARDLTRATHQLEAVERAIPLERIVIGNTSPIKTQAVKMISVHSWRKGQAERTSRTPGACEEEDEQSNESLRELKQQEK